MRLSSCVLAVLLTLPDLSAPAAFAADRPNIVFILADDLGYTDVACYGSKYYETPNIDRLAGRGMKFTSGYTAGPNCQPTRAALITGQYGPRTGIYTVGGTDRFDTSKRPLVPVENVTDLAPAKVTVAEVLKSAGYATAMFGKWHLGNGEAHHPLAQGFDEAIVSQGQHFGFNTRPKVKVPEGAYLADFLTDKAVDFIQRHKEGPFFLYLPHFGVHSPHHAKDDMIARFKDKPAAGGHDSPVYAAMIASVDESVGRVVATLEDLGLTEKTLVIFSSDNGGVGGYDREGIRRAGGITDNAPLRGGKGMLYEGGVRVPFIACWPGRIKAGMVCDEPVISVDVLPTFAELAGGKLPEGPPLDGESIVKVFEATRTLGAAGSLPARVLRRDAVYWHFPGYLGAGQNDWRTTPAGAVREGDYKLLEFFEDGRLELYDLRSDLSQQRDLAKANPEVVQRLHAKLTKWRDDVGAKMPERRVN
jgi:arylsulfatase A-like enzyme